MLKNLSCCIVVLLFNVSVSYAAVNNQTLALLVNINDPESLEIAKYYQQARAIPEKNVIQLSFKHGVSSLTETEFKNIETQLKQKVPEHIQTYALSWRKPWRVGCMSITSAFALGFSQGYCAVGCKKTTAIDYFNSNSEQPYTDYGIRPSMMLVAGSVESVKRLIARGVSADNVMKKTSAYLLSTSDKQRNVRAINYPSVQQKLSRSLNVELIEADVLLNKQDVMFYFTGKKKVKFIDTNNYLPGAIADHLTSSGGQLFESGQMSILEWIEAGVTGSYGAVVEPCNFPQKFPHPEVVITKYLSGESLIEAYWKSVQMPGQGVFVGEPLSSPYKGCRLNSYQSGGRYFSNNPPVNFVERRFRNCS